MIARAATKATTPMTIPAMAPADRVSWCELPMAVGWALADVLALMAVPDVLLLPVVRDAEVVGRVVVDSVDCVDVVSVDVVDCVDSVVCVVWDVGVVSVLAAVVGCVVGVSVGDGVAVAVAGGAVAASVGTWKPVGTSAAFKVPVTVISIGTATPVGAPVGTSGKRTVTKTFAASCGLLFSMVAILIDSVSTDLESYVYSRRFANYQADRASARAAEADYVDFGTFSLLMVPFNSYPICLRRMDCFNCC